MRATHTVTPPWACTLSHVSNRLVVAVRSAALDWKRRLEAAGDRRERDELLGGLPSQAQVRNTTAGDNGSGSSTSFNSAVSGTSRTASKAAADVTTALRRTNQLMQAELERSAQTLRQIGRRSRHGTQCACSLSSDLIMHVPCHYTDDVAHSSLSLSISFKTTHRSWQDASRTSTRAGHAVPFK